MKKRVLLILLIICMFMFASPVLAKDITACDEVLGSSVVIDEKIPNAVSTIVLIIKIAVPVLLVVFGMLDFAKSMIAQKEDEIKKGQKIFIKRIISGAVVFLIFSVVQLLISFVGNGAEAETNIMTCANCFINGDCFVITEKIRKIMDEGNDIVKQIEALYNKCTTSDYNSELWHKIGQENNRLNSDLVSWYRKNKNDCEECSSFIEEADVLVGKINNCLNNKYSTHFAIKEGNSIVKDLETLYSNCSDAGFSEKAAIKAHKTLKNNELTSWYEKNKNNCEECSTIYEKAVDLIEQINGCLNE